MLPLPPRTPVVLLLGLCPAVTEAFALMLRAMGASPIMASAPAARRLLGTGVPVDAAICHCLAETDEGEAIVDWLHAHHPEVSRVVVCADDRHTHVDADQCPILRSPYDRRDVEQALLRAGLSLPGPSDDTQPVT